MEKRFGERTHPCGAPVFTITSSDYMGYLLREPFNLTRCGRSHRNCLIHRIRSGFTSRFNNFLIRTCGCIVLKADEKSINRTLNQLITYRSFHAFSNDRCERHWSKVIKFSSHNTPSVSRSCHGPRLVRCESWVSHV